MKINQSAKNKNWLVHFVSLFMLVLLAGCGSIQVGRDFDVKAFESMAKVGETTRKDVRKVLGPPKSTGVSITRDGEDLVEWVYFYATGKMSTMERAELKILQIRFEQSGKLRSYNWSNSDI